MKHSQSSVTLKQYIYWLPMRTVGKLRAKGIPIPHLPERFAGKLNAFWRKCFTVQPPICEDLNVWVEQTYGKPPVLLTTEREISRTLPRTLEPEILSSITRRVTTTIPARYLYTLHNVRMTGSVGLVILSDNSFASESTYNTEYLKAEEEYSIPLDFKREKKQGSYFSLLGKFSNTTNYFHWMHDGLFRLYGTEQLLPPDTRIIVPRVLLPHQVETLQLLGIQDRCVSFPGNNVWELETLYLASLPPSGRDLHEMAEWYRGKMLRAAHAPERATKKRLYLSRRLDKHARVTNDDEVFQAIAPLGFELVSPAKLSVREQVVLFSQAEVIVSATSSGLTNMIYAPDSVKILELFEPQWAERQAYVLWSLCDALGIEYWYLVGNSVPNPKAADRADLYVPPDKLLRTLKEMQLA